MGKRGRAPAPTALKLLRGDRPDRINTSEPKPTPATVIAPPSWLTQRAKNVWTRYAPDLIRQGVLTGWDVETFAALCDAVVRRRDAVEAIRRMGAVCELPVFNRNGEHTGNRLAKNPWCLVLSEVDAQFRYYAARFGMTASDRAQLTLTGTDEGPGDDLLS